MAQIFPPGANTLSRATLAALLLLIILGGWIGGETYRSPWATRVNVVTPQPVPFSHEHHVGGLGIDCRYCHTSVETAPFAGIPEIETCMTCHSKIWTNAELLAPIRQSWQSGQAIHWNRVYNLPTFVYFDHSIHINKGVGCYTCHGEIDRMPMTYQANPLLMQWCLSCHREPEKFLRPRDKVFDMSYRPPPNQLELGKQLVKEYHVNKPQLQNCSVCHR